MKVLNYAFKINYTLVLEIRKSLILKILRYDVFEKNIQLSKNSMPNKS
jgi:hypothetical protein